MFIGDITARSKEDALRFRQLTYTCMQNSGTRAPETLEFPKTPCTYGIMANVRFPTCWDGVNLDSPDHMAHMAYPENGTFESQGPCPSSHPVRMPQVLFEVVWDTKQFNNKADWPADGSQPFTWAFGDHHSYQWVELQRLAEQARVHSSSILLTTQKDAANLPDRVPRATPGPSPG